MTNGKKQMPNDVLQQAIIEAYASSPSDVFIYHTLEIKHPDFIDDDGKPTTIRIVQGFHGITATLETGEEVGFCYLRYGEFIALNTNEIQKLKKRVAELEAQLTRLTAAT